MIEIIVNKDGASYCNASGKNEDILFELLAASAMILDTISTKLVGSDNIARDLIIKTLKDEEALQALRKS